MDFFEDSLRTLPSLRPGAIALGILCSRTALTRPSATLSPRERDSRQDRPKLLRDVCASAVNSIWFAAMPRCAQEGKPAVLYITSVSSHPPPFWDEAARPLTFEAKPAQQWRGACSMKLVVFESWPAFQEAGSLCRKRTSISGSWFSLSKADQHFRKLVLFLES